MAPPLIRGALQLWALASVLALAGCDLVDPAPPGLRFTATADVSPTVEGPTLRVSLHAQNLLDRPRTLVYGGCRAGLTLQLWRPGESVPAWNSKAPVGAVCTLALIEWIVPAGTTASLDRTFRVEDILGTSLPDRRYRLTAAPDLRGVREDPLEMGQFDLHR